MKIKTTKEIQYRKVKYQVDTERQLAFTPWVLREARKSFHFLHKRGLLQPTQENLNLKTKLKKMEVGWVAQFFNYIRRCTRT
jgi:fructose/tagatose bisphosphate aldolase